ncbi:tail fiber domain-containing protein [Pseudolabrys taiwanensis]|nr:tail fiber domain-containing protein [Pseudolabrys taiwanensis]
MSKPPRPKSAAPFPIYDGFELPATSQRVRAGLVAIGKRSLMRRWLLPVLGLILLAVAQPVQAACHYPDADEGNIMYNDDYNIVQYCDGVNWVSMGGGVTDARIGTLTANKWCAANAGGNGLECTQDAPVGVLSGLSDVDATGLADGNILKYSGTAGKWQTVSAGTADPSSAFSATAPSGGTLAIGTNVIVYTSVSFDTHSDINPSTGTFTAPASGVYVFAGNVQVVGNPTNYYTQFAVNGIGTINYGSRFNSTTGAASHPISHVSAVLKLNAGDTVRLAAYTDTSVMLASAVFSGARLSGGGIGGASTLAGLSDVDASGAANGKSLVYNGSTNKWEAQTISGSGSAQVAFHVDKNGATQPTSGQTVVTWPNEVYDTNNNFASNRFTPTVAGKYLIVLSTYMANATTISSIFKNTSTVAQSYSAASNGITPVSAIVDMNGTTDYIEARAESITGSTTLSGVPAQTYMTGILLNGGGPSGGSSQWSDVTGGINYAGGNVGIGTATPAERLEVFTDANAVPPRIFLTTVGVGSPGFIGRRADGSVGSLAAIAGADEYLAYFGGRGYNGSAWTSAAASFIGMLSSQAWTTTANGSYMNFYTTPNNSTTSAERMRIDASGNVGIGTATPGTPLHVYSTATAPLVQSEVKWDNVNSFSGFYAQTESADNSVDSSLYILAHASERTVTRYGLTLGGWSEIVVPAGATNGNGLAIGTAINKPIVFGTNSLERMRIDSNGNVGIGVTTPLDRLQVAGGLRLSAVTPVLRLNNSSAASGSQSWQVQNNNGLYFGTTADDFSSWQTSAVLYLDRSGRIGVGTASPTAKFEVAGNTIFLHTSGGANFQMMDDSATAGSKRFQMAVGSGYLTLGPVSDDNTSWTATAMQVNHAGNVGIGGGPNASYALNVTGTAYATGAAGALSDIRHKKDIHTLPEGELAKVMKLRPVSFLWKQPVDDGMKGEQLGFIAQEVEQVLPSIVLTQDDKDRTKGLKYTEIIPVLTRAIQELKADNDNLRAALKAANDNEEKEFRALRAEIDVLKKARHPVAAHKGGS